MNQLVILLMIRVTLHVDLILTEATMPKELGWGWGESGKR